MQRCVDLLVLKLPKSEYKRELSGDSASDHSPTMRDGIFICYRRRDASALAGRLYDHLVDWFPGKVFMDVEDITPGHDFRDRLTNVMDQCQVVVALIGTNWTPSLRQDAQVEHSPDYVVSELEQAINAGLVVIPLLLDGTPMPPSEELPASLRALRFHHALDVRTQCFTRDIRPLRAAICRSCGLVPPTLWEEFVSRLPGMKTVDERARDTMARVSLVAAVVGLCGLVVRDTYAVAFVCFFVSCWTGVVGVNSRRRRLLAFLGMSVSVVGFMLLLWLVISRIAQA